MPRIFKSPIKTGTTNMPNHPIISDIQTKHVGHRDTLDRVAHVLDLLNHIDFSEALPPSAERGLFWIHSMLIDSVKYVSDSLAQDDR